MAQSFSAPLCAPRVQQDSTKTLWALGILWKRCWWIRRTDLMESAWAANKWTKDRSSQDLQQPHGRASFSGVFPYTDEQCSATELQFKGGLPERPPPEVQTTTSDNRRKSLFFFFFSQHSSGLRVWNATRGEWQWTDALKGAPSIQARGPFYSWVK